MPSPDGGFTSAVTDEDLDLLARWGATAISVPVALDRVLEIPDVPDPRIQLPLGLSLESAPGIDVGELGHDYLDALDQTVQGAQERGLYTVIQLAALRTGGADRPVPFDALRQFWRMVGSRWADSPSVLFDLLRAPHRVELFGARQDVNMVAAQQLRTLLLALLGELRAVHPLALAIAEYISGTVGSSPLTYTDGSLAPGVLVGYRCGSQPQVPSELLGLARRVPVVVLGWATDENRPPNDAPGRRLAAAGLHWVAEGWPATGTLATGRAPVATPAGRVVQSALAQPDVEVATSATAGRSGPVRLALPGTGDGGGRGAGAGHAGQMLAQMLLAAAPVGGPVSPLPADIAPGPGMSAAVYLPSLAGLERQLQALDVAGRIKRVGDQLALVLPEWQQAQVNGAMILLNRIRPAQQQAGISAPKVPRGLPGAVPKFLHEALDVDATSGAGLGKALVEGRVTVADAATGSWTSAQAIVGLRRLQDILFRLRAARACASATGADLATVLALFRTEGALAMPASASSIDAGVPSGTTDAVTSLRPRPDISNMVWLASGILLAPLSDATVADIATKEFLIQIVGLDVLGSRPAGGAWYQAWTYQIWKSAGVDNLGTAIARSLLLRDAVSVRRLTPAPPTRSAVAALVKDPVSFVGAALGDGVQLLRSFTDPLWLLGPGPLPAGAPTWIDLPLAYLRYNIGADQMRLALVSAVLAAAATKATQWADLRNRIAATPNLRTQLAAMSKASGNQKTPAEKATAAALAWPPLQPWCLIPGNLDALTQFVYEASAGEWSTGWMRPRGNVARFRLLHHYYGLLTGPGPGP